MAPDLIFDVGMHIGQDSEFYLKKGYRVVAIEANPVLCAEVSARLASYIDEKRLTILNLGITSEVGRLDFYVNDTLSHWSSFEPELGARLGSFHVVEVETRPLSAIVSEFGVPYYLKIDIEGYDVLALTDVLNAGQFPPYVSVENPSRSLVDLFAAHGYEGFKLINQATVQDITLPRPALEGEDVDHIFPFGASGPFGRETTGEWLTAAEAGDAADRYWAQPGLDPEKHGWFDLHACRKI